MVPSHDIDEIRLLRERTLRPRAFEYDTFSAPVAARA
jgi:hypothetical protein